MRGGAEFLMQKYINRKRKEEGISLDRLRKLSGYSVRSTLSPFYSSSCSFSSYDDIMQVLGLSWEGFGEFVREARGSNER